ncbi:MAG: hypothetical protein ACKKMV_00815 [Candidatus Nealsonbacteria bacterium]
MEELFFEEPICPFCGEAAAIVRQRRAQKIMGKNFFGIEEVIKHFKVNPTHQQLTVLAKIPFSERVLEELKDSYILVAVFPLSILDIRSKVDSKLFYDQSWYNNESFAEERGEAGWQLVRKTPVPSSASKNWSEQQKLLAKNDEVPTARIMVYTIIGYYLATGERLFKDIWVRTSSLPSDGYRVRVGCFYLIGLRFFYYWDGLRNIGISLAASRKFPAPQQN